MTYIVCVDDRMGMTFGGKRLSRDREMLSRMKAAIGRDSLCVLAYSQKLFADGDVAVVADAACRSADTALFLETVDPTPYLRAGDRLIVYRWGRHYPSDMRLTIDTATLRSVSSVPFVGSSHPEMIEDIYTI